ncbi:hypothetical protein [Terriglobus aquaticus]|uniref:Uncharacterized protein n=1 Tax=Terriglobus aquaticus TaxID=940139 RepID=A0ABW9KH57_9BACT|nr:hypothetical protein [Terriglobus aquaticus]
MKTLRTVAIALALTAAATVASLPSVNAGDTTAKGKVMQASAPVPTCPPGDPNACGMFSR